MGFVAVCTALYDYQPQGTGELEITEGELLYILEQSTEDDWWKARKKAAEDEEDEPEGLIPNNYVQEAKPAHSAKALYDYSRQTDEEVSFSEDAQIDVYDISDPDWTLVGVNGEYGFAPANYIEIQDGARSPSIASARPSVTAPADPIIPTTPTSPARDVSGPAASLARVLGGAGPAPTSRNIPSPSAPQQQLTPEASDEEPAPALPRRPPSQTMSPPVQQHARYPDDEPPGVLPSPPYNRAHARVEEDEPMHSPGGFHLYNISEMVSAMGRRKKMPTTLGLNVTTGTIMLAPERSRDGPQQEWTAEKLTHYSIEGKHVFLELVRPSKSLDLHAGAKDTAEEIVATLGTIAGAAKGEGLKEVIAASAGGSVQKKGQVLYEFMAQGDDEVTVAVGDEVIIIDDTRSEDWFQVRRIKNGKEGVMPSSYIEITGTVVAEPPSRQGINAGRSTVEQNRLEEERLAKQAARSRPRGESKSEAPPMPLPTRGSSLGDEERKQRKRSSKSEKQRSKPDTNKTRTWTDHSGSFKVEAQFIGIADGKIHLHKVNGVKIAVPVSKMSPPDIAYVEKVTQESIEEHMPVADLIKMKQKSRSGQAGASIQPSQPKVSDYDWFQFFLDAGVGPHQCERYAQAMVRDSMDESVLPDIGADTLRTLGLKEGDALKVMKHLDQRFGRNRVNGEGGLFSKEGGKLKDNTRSRPDANRQVNDVVDPAAFEEKKAEARETPLAKAPAREAKAGFDDDAWSVKKAPEPKAVTPPPPKPALTPGMSELSILDTPLVPSVAAPAPKVQSPPPAPQPPPQIQQPQQQQPSQQQPQQMGATPSFFSQVNSLNVPRQRPAPPPQQNFTGALLPPPQRPLSAPQNPSQFGAQPLQPQLTGMPQRQAPYGQSMDEITAQRLQQQQQQFQQMQLQPQQTGFMPQFNQFQNGMQPQQTGFQQPYLNGNAAGSPFADPNPRPQFQPQPTGFGQFNPQSPPPGGVNSILPPALQPHRTGFPQQPNGFGQQQLQPQQTGFGQMPQQQQFQPQPQQTGFQQIQTQPTGFGLPPQPLQQLQPQQTGFGQPPQQNGFQFQPPPIPPMPTQSQSPAPLVPQKTGPAPEIRFGAAPKKLAPQPTGRRANLASASKLNTTLFTRSILTAL